MLKKQNSEKLEAKMNEMRNKTQKKKKVSAHARKCLCECYLLVVSKLGQASQGFEECYSMLYAQEKQ